jgi:hypothetical protein
MTIERHSPGQSSNAQSGPAQREYQDALQAYLRRLHEAGAGQAGDSEPRRGRDPWLGLAL